MDAEQLGQQLRAAREAQELTLEDAEQALRIRAKFLKAFETGDYEDLPGAVQARGFLSNYARLLKLDPDAVLAQYDAILASAPTRPRWKRRSPPTQPSMPLVVEESGEAYGGPEYLRGEKPSGRGRRVAVLVGVLVGGVVLAGLCLGGIQVVEQVLTSEAGREGPSILEALPTVPSVTPSATFLPSPTLLAGQGAVALGPPITDRVVISVEVVQRTWVRITTDGEIQYEGLVSPGATLQYQAAGTLNVQASNGAGLDVIFNNIPIGLLGGRGEVVDTTFTPDMALTPTATFTVPPPVLATPREAQPTPLSPGGDDQTPTLVPPAGQLTLEPSPLVTLAATPTPAPTLTLEPTATRTPMATATPSLTRTPTPTVILPPRLTSTPTPQKPG